MSPKQRTVALGENRERDVQINFRVTDEEEDAFRKAARAAGLSLSDWLRLNARIGAGLTRGPRP